MADFRVPFNKPTLVGNELRHMAQAVNQGHLAGDGPFTKRCSELLEAELGVEKVFLTPSCTHALEMCGLLLDFRPGDEVIVPSFAFVTTANAFVMTGATPVFADIRPDTLNLDEARLRERITPRTKAIVALHYGGIGCELDEIMKISCETGVAVVEDNAHGLFGSYKGKFLGRFGWLAAQSFHETKNFTCGEGGALLINRPELIERAEILREKGTDRSRLFRGEVDEYTWIDRGSSYLPSELQAAFLYGQLEAREQIQKTREGIWQRYEQGLRGWAAEHGVELPRVPVECSHPYHLFYLLLPSKKTRQALIRHLRERDIIAVFHYLPLHLSKMGGRFGGRPGACPVAEDISDRILRLPFYTGLGEPEQARVIEAVLDFGGFGSSGRPRP